MKLVVGRAYFLDGMKTEMWGNSHPIYGTPYSLAARYIGALHGSRRWHGFEVWSDGVERGVLFMNDDDLKQLNITPVQG